MCSAIWEYLWMYVCTCMEVLYSAKKTPYMWNLAENIFHTLGACIKLMCRVQCRVYTVHTAHTSRGCAEGVEWNGVGWGMERVEEGRIQLDRQPRSICRRRNRGPSSQTSDLRPRAYWDSRRWELVRLAMQSMPVDVDRTTIR